MSLVLDGSMAVAWCFADEQTEAVRDVLHRVAADGAIIPAHWPLEVANALTMAMRRQRLTASSRQQSLRDMEALAIRIDTATGEQAWRTTMQLADRHRLTLYDAAYLELAIRVGLPLASLDRDLKAAAHQEDVPTLRG